MNEQKMIRMMVLSSVAGGLISTGLCMIFYTSGLIRDVSSYLLGAFPSILGFIIICMQFRGNSRSWVLYTMLGYGLRLLIYASAILVLFLIDGNPLALLLGLIFPKLGLIFLALRR